MVEQLILLSLLTLLASVIGTISGFGISSIMIPIMSLFYPLPLTLLFVAIIHLFGDIWKIVFFRRSANWRIILLFGIPGILFSYVGATMSFNVPANTLKQLLGGFLLVYVLFLIYQQNWKLTATNSSSILGGSLSGIFAGIFGVGGAVRSAFLMAYNLPKEMFIFTSGMIALFVDVTRITKYLMGGTTMPVNFLYILFVLVPLSLLGAYIAKRIVDKVSQKLFRIIIAVLLGLIAVKYLLFI